MFAMLLLVGAYACLPGEYLFGLEWLWLFAFGYLYSRMSVSVRRFIILISCIIVLICLYRIHYDGSILWSNFNRCNRVFHCALGIFLFSTAVFICTMRIPRWVSCMDFYSYEIYLAHFVFMIGPGSLIGKTGSKIGDIMLMLLLSVLVACFLKYASRYLAKIFQKGQAG